MFPELPPWEGMHPIVVHFPIALLTVAPVLVLLGLFWPGQSRGLRAAALALMLMGTAGAFVAMESGEATEHAHQLTRELRFAIHEHEELAETAWFTFLALTGTYLVLFFAPMVLKKEPSRKLDLGLQIAFLVPYLLGVVVLANAGHQGGLLVHQLGIRAPMTEGDLKMMKAPAEPAAPAKGGEEDEDDGPSADA